MPKYFGCHSVEFQEWQWANKWSYLSGSWQLGLECKRGVMVSHVCIFQNTHLARRRLKAVSRGDPSPVSSVWEEDEE